VKRFHYLCILHGFSLILYCSGVWDASPFESEHTEVKKIAPLTSRRSGTTAWEMLNLSRSTHCAASLDRARNETSSSFAGGYVVQEKISIVSGTDDEPISAYFDEDQCSGSLTNTDGDHPSKCSIIITDSSRWTFSITRKLPRRQTAASASVTEDLQSFILNTIERNVICSNIEEVNRNHTSSSSSSSSASSSSASTTSRKNSNSEDVYVPFLYPFIKIPYVLESLRNYAEDNNNIHVKNFLQKLRVGNPTVSLALLSHISIYPSGVQNFSSEVDSIRYGGSRDSDTFRLYATNEYSFKRGFTYKLDKVSRRYDCAMFKYVNPSGDVILQPARIFAIIQITDESKNEVYVLQKRSSTATVDSTYSRRSTKTMLEKTLSSGVNKLPRRGKTDTPTTNQRRECDSGKPPVVPDPYRDEGNKVLLLVCWLSNADKGFLRKSFPYPYYKYDSIRHGNQNVLYTQILHPSSLVLPLYTIHDVDTRPTFELEGSTYSVMRNDRFWSFPFEIFRKLRRQYYGCFKPEFLLSPDDTVDDDDDDDDDDAIESFLVKKDVTSISTQQVKNVKEDGGSSDGGSSDGYSSDGSDDVDD
jgi:hypothetical protein